MEEKLCSCEQLSFKFEGDTSIEADLLVNSLSNLISAYKATVRTCYSEQEEFEVRVNSFAPGSFDVILDTVVQYAPAVVGFIPEAVSCAKTFLEMMRLKRELKGQKPKAVSTEGDTTKIVNVEGDVNFYNCNIATNYFQNPTIDNSLSKVFDVLGSSGRPGVTVSADADVIQISNDEYQQLSVPLISDKDDKCYTTVRSTIKALLPIKTPDLLGNSKWNFMYEGKIISATMADEEFNSLVKNGGIMFGAGMLLPVEMLIEVDLDEKLEEVHRRHTIIKVTGPIISKEDLKGQQLALEEFM